MLPDLLNKNTFIFVDTDENIDDINLLYEKVGLSLPVPFIKEKQWYDTLCKIYMHAIENGLEHVTCFTKNAYPRPDVIEKFNNEFKDFNDDWGIISWSRIGDISGWYPGNIKIFLNERKCVDISKNIVSTTKKYNEYLNIIPHYSLGFDAFSINTESFPLFLDRLNYFNDYPACALANDDYQGYIKTYHTKDLYFCNRTDGKWIYPLTYNENRSGFTGNPRNNPPEGFSIL